MAANWPKLPALNSPEELDGPLPQGWRLEQVENLYEQLPFGKRFDQKSSTPRGSVPVIDQSESGVIGWHDEQPGVVASPGRPVVTFANHTCEMRWMRRPFSVIQNVFPLIGKTGVCDTRFLYYGTKGRVYLEEYKGHFPDYRRKWIPVPELAEQRAIAHILGTLDDKIELNRRMSGTLEAMARALFKSWFVDFDPVRAKMEGRDTGLPPHLAALFPERLVDSELGEIPEGWSVGRVEDLCEGIFSGGTPSTQNPEYWNGNVPWLSSGETREKFIVDTERRITPAGVSRSSTRQAPRWSTVIASAGQGNTRGQTSMLTFESYINQSVVVLVANPATSSPHHLFYDLERRYDEFRRISDAHSSRGSLTTRLIAQLPVALPPRALVRRFDSIAFSLVDRLVSMLEQSKSLTSMRDSLLPKLVSGELRVPEELCLRVAEP